LHATPASFVGHYTGPQGQFVDIRPHGGGMDLEISRNGETHLYDAYVLNLDGVSVWEITMAEPDAAKDPQGRAQLPAYMYGRVEQSSDGLVIRRLRTEWLEQQAKSMPDTAFGRTPQIAEGSGAIVVRHPAAMESLLRKAVHDPAAFGEPETFKRVN
jgi:hypothetical protein